MSADKLPDGWTRVRLEEVITRTSKRCTPEVSPSVRWIGADHLEEGDLSVRRWSTTDDPMFPPTFYFSVPSGSVLLHSRNPKKVAILPFDAITGEKLFCLTPVDSSTLDSRFLAYQLQSDHFHEFVSRWLSGSVNKFLNWTALARYEFALPPIDEQKRIIDVLARADSVHEHWRSVEAAASALLDAHIRRLVTSVAGAESVALTEIADLQPGRQLSPQHRRSIRPVSYLRAANLKLDYIDREDIKMMDFTVEDETRFGVLKGDILLVEGGDPDKVGAPCFVDFEPAEPLCMQNTVIRVRVRPGGYNARYLYWYLRARFARGDFEKLATGTKLYHLGVRKVEGLRAPIVAKERQAAVATELDGWQAFVAGARAQIVTAARLRSALVESLLNGYGL